MQKTKQNKKQQSKGEQIYLSSEEETKWKEKNVATHSAIKKLPPW